MNTSRRVSILVLLSLFVASGLTLLFVPSVFAEDCSGEGQEYVENLLKEWEWEYKTRISSDIDSPTEIEKLEEGVSEIIRSPPPNTRPLSVQNSSPSGDTNNSVDLVNGADFPAILGLAVDSGIIQSDDEKLTLNMNFFALASLRNPKRITSQSLYQEPVNEKLRRWATTVSFGGKGQKFDQNGDGEVDEAKEAEELFDIVNWEIRYRGSKSRDLRESYNWHQIQNSSLLNFLEIEFLKSSWVLADHVQAALKKSGALNVETNCISKEEWEDFKTSVEKLADSLKAEADSESPNPSKQIVINLETAAAYLDAYEKARQLEAARVQKRFVWSLAAGGVEREEDFGTDSLYFEFRGDKPIGDKRAFKINARWEREDALPGQVDDPENFKLGFEWSTLVKSIKKEGAVFSFAGSWEQFENVEDAPHDSIGKFSVKWEQPIADGLSLPISVTWAEHADIFTDEDEVVGHFALSYDLSKIFKQED